MAEDLGIKTKRKSNFLSEMFVPYRPSDYKGLLDEFYKVEKQRRGPNGSLKTIEDVEKA